MRGYRVNLCIVIGMALVSVAASRAEEKLPEGLFLKEAPSAAANVGALKKTAKEGDEVVLRGQIGGQEKDVFNATRATFMIADMKLIPCNKVPGDKCETPWDFCCVPVNERNKDIAVVQIVDAKGKLLKTTLKGASGLDHLSVVVVKGKVSKLDGANMIINASGIYVEPAAKEEVKK